MFRQEGSWFRLYMSYSTQNCFSLVHFRGFFVKKARTIMYRYQLTRGNVQLETWNSFKYKSLKLKHSPWLNTYNCKYFINASQRACFRGISNKTMKSIQHLSPKSIKMSWTKHNKPSHVIIKLTRGKTCHWQESFVCWQMHEIGF